MINSMVLTCFLVLLSGCVLEAVSIKTALNSDLEQGRQFLEENNAKDTVFSNKLSNAIWNYESNLTQENKEASLAEQQKYAEFKKEQWKKAMSFAWQDFEDQDAEAYRRFKILSYLGDAALPDKEFQELTELIADMSDLYGKAKIPKFGAEDNDATLSLEPDISELLSTSENYDELQHLWVEWRNATGKKVKKQFLRYAELENKVAELNDFRDAGRMWRREYESEKFPDIIEKIWQDIKPFYMQLHAFVRRNLIEKYPGKIKKDGPIPAHLLGNMWSQTWSNIYKRMTPYENETEIDVTEAMLDQNITVVEMFKISEEFFTSLGLIPMTPEFWNRSIFVKPTDREMVCHASAWDFYDGKDTRIKMCTVVNMDDLITVHHEMGHIEYFLQYADQPMVFRTGANPGFHEAVGDTLALSVSTPKHLQSIGLLAEVSENEKADINYLLKIAMDKLAFLPFAYTVDSWRWKIFSGEITPDALNTKWWENRLYYQGICPPVKRTEDDLDAASKYHVIANVPYIRYFVSHILQFQFHKLLCEEAGYEGPLHKCDIYKSKAAGKLFSDVLKKGYSVNWNEALSVMTKNRTDQMEVTGFLEYFEPLIKWLKVQNKDEYIGWKSEDPTSCPEFEASADLQAPKSNIKGSL